MTPDNRLTPDQARERAATVLRRAGASRPNAESVAKALVSAEVDGQAGHGLSRLPSYAAQTLSGKIRGQAEPRVVSTTSSFVRIDAGYGFAYPACDLARERLQAMASAQGVAAAAIFNSHHFGQAGYHVEQLAERGLVALMMGNSPKAIAPWGGRDALFGTNPIAFAAPRPAPEIPLVIDLSLSRVARGKVMVAAKEGRNIPPDWAFDEEGHPTTDPNAALRGSMAPMGDAKGAALVMMVEILAAALTGSRFGFEASSFFSAEGDAPGVGQLLIAFEPELTSGSGFVHRIEHLLSAMQQQPGVRLPGSRRQDLRMAARERGIEWRDALSRELGQLGLAS